MNTSANSRGPIDGGPGGSTFTGILPCKPAVRTQWATASLSIRKSLFEKLLTAVSPNRHQLISEGGSERGQSPFFISRTRVCQRNQLIWSSPSPHLTAKQHSPMNPQDLQDLQDLQAFKLSPSPRSLLSLSVDESLAYESCFYRVTLFSTVDFASQCFGEASGVLRAGNICSDPI